MIASWSRASQVSAVALVAGVLALIAVSPTAAQSPPAESLPSAEEIDALFIQASEDFKAERFEAALASLEKIVQVTPEPLIFFNIARCHEELGAKGEAISAFEEALSLGLPEAQRDEAMARLKALRGEGEEVAPSTDEVVEVPVEAPERARASPRIVAGLHAGATVPQVFSELTLAATFGLDVGYLPPVDIGPFVRPLQIGLGISFTNPPAEGQSADPDLGDEGRAVVWSLEERMLVLELNAAWRFMPLTERWSAFAQLGPKLYLMESILKASSGGADFGEQRETRTHVGFSVGGGVDLSLGPGSAFAALEIGGSDLDKTITGDANTGAVSLELGYRLHF